MSAMPTEPFVPVDHRERRDRRLLRATVWSPEIGQQDALVRNISRNGLGGIVSTAPLALGMHVVVTLLAGLQLPGTVMWTRGTAFGLRLREDVDLDFVADELRKQVAAHFAAGEWEVSSRHQQKQEQREPPGPVRRL